MFLRISEAVVLSVSYVLKSSGDYFRNFDAWAWPLENLTSLWWIVARRIFKVSLGDLIYMQPELRTSTLHKGKAGQRMLRFPKAGIHRDFAVVPDCISNHLWVSFRMSLFFITWIRKRSLVWREYCNVNIDLSNGPPWMPLLSHLDLSDAFNITDNRILIVWLWPLIHCMFKVHSIQNLQMLQDFYCLSD